MPGELSGGKRALIVCIDGTSSMFNMSANGAHRDARALREYLIRSQGYEPNDIVLMLNDRHLPKHLLPTRSQILRQADNLVRNAPEDCHFFFYYSAHGHHQSLHESFADHCVGGADERNDGVVSANGKSILDHLLHDRLITPLQNIKGSKLFALLDCCHSETLLDLKQREPPYRRDCSLGIRRIAKGIATGLLDVGKFLLRMGDIKNVPSEYYCQWSSDCLPTVGQDSEASSRMKNRESIVRHVREDVERVRRIRHLHELERLQQLETSRLYQLEQPRNPRVICLSACSDGDTQMTHSGGHLTFTKCFLKAVSARPNMTWVELREELKALTADVRIRYRELSLNTPKHVHKVHMGWSKEPRYSTTPDVDLTQLIEF